MQYLLNKQEQKACNSISSLELEFIDFQLFNKVLLKAEALKNNWHFNNYLSQKKKKIYHKTKQPTPEHNIYIFVLQYGNSYQVFTNGISMARRVLADLKQNGLGAQSKAIP